MANKDFENQWYKEFCAGLQTMVEETQVWLNSGFKKPELLAVYAQKVAPNDCASAAGHGVENFLAPLKDMIVDALDDPQLLSRGTSRLRQHRALLTKNALWETPPDPQYYHDTSRPPTPEASMSDPAISPTSSSCETEFKPTSPPASIQREFEARRAAEEFRLEELAGSRRLHAARNERKRNMNSERGLPKGRLTVGTAERQDPSRGRPLDLERRPVVTSKVRKHRQRGPCHAKLNARRPGVTEPKRSSARLRAKAARCDTQVPIINTNQIERSKRV